ncbi:venom allergen 3-like [Tribolium madens]|uniref:venom allergen 3-like n=1 Tax=Tribolium madens TaxID=41895 RepID=UPI001CF73A35|nr:venom allergen 3-like [Tribolium madens]
MVNFALIFIFSLTVVGLRANICGEVFERGVVDDEIKQQIVNKHNELHSLVVSGLVPGQPKGKNLKTLNIIGWRSTGKKDGPDFLPMIESWFSQYSRVTYPNTLTGGFYGQIVWNETQYIGCGYIHFRKTPKDWYEKIYFCHYGPGGNIPYVPPYEKA